MTTRYTKDHEWVRLEGDVAIVGITAYAAEQLGDVVFAELPAEGVSFAQGAEMAVVESAKTASDVYAPISGVITAANEAIQNANWETINQSPQADGWFVKMRPSNKAEFYALMDEAAYADYVKGL
ncbi:MAG: glycine cleavage system protein GcvH [Hyphomonadaceae bacterium]|nr:glycine cleavage system protein GcvH [Hyphomonadaceae bacterium]